MTSVTTRSRGNIFMKKEAYSPSRPSRASSTCSSASSTSSTSSNSMEAGYSTPCVRRPSIDVSKPLFEKQSGHYLSRKFLPKHIPRSDFTLPPEYAMTLPSPKPAVTKKTPKRSNARKSLIVVNAAPTLEIMEKAQERYSTSPPPVLEMECYIDENVEVPPAKRRCLHSKVSVNKEDLRKKLASRWSTRVTEEKRSRGEERGSPKIVLSISTLQCHLCSFSTLSASSLIAHLSSAHKSSLLEHGRLLRCSSCGTYVKDELQEKLHREMENGVENAEKEVERSTKCPEKWTVVRIRPSHVAHLLKSSQ